MTQKKQRKQKKRRRPQKNPKPPPEIDAEVVRVLKLLKFLIKHRGFTQLKIQDKLGWGRTYISQLFRQQKSLRFDQILQIVQVIGVHPVDFFGLFYDASWVNGGGPEALDIDLRTSLGTRVTSIEMGLLANGERLLAALGLLVEMLGEKGLLDECLWRAEVEKLLEEPTRVEDLAAKVTRAHAPGRRLNRHSLRPRRAKKSGPEMQEIFSIMGLLVELLEKQGVVSKTDVTRALGKRQRFPVRNETLALMFGTEEAIQ